VACDVGQGDAILAQYGTFQILTDGGLPNGRVVACLSRYMPFWDRKIEVVVNTHPQLDHYGGLIDVLRSYDVTYLVANGLESGSREYQVLKKLVGDRGIKVVTPISGQSLRYGMMRYDILFPTSEFLETEGWSGESGNLGTFDSKRDPNDFSVQAVVSFGQFDALLTGDIGESMLKYVSPVFVAMAREKVVEYIKMPHHGSKYGLGRYYVGLASPQVAVIQVGKNSYGHPTTEVLDFLNANKMQVYRNDLDGDIVLASDGESYSITTQKSNKNGWRLFK